MEKSLQNMCTPCLQYLTDTSLATHTGIAIQVWLRPRNAARLHDTQNILIHFLSNRGIIFHTT